MNKFDLIRERLDWVHDTDGYCIQYEVMYWTAEWSVSKYWIVTGLTANGAIVDLGRFETYYSQYAWLSECIGIHTKS